MNIHKLFLGNLYFAHVKATDMQKTATAPDGRIYKCSVYNSYTEVSLYTSPSKIIVNECKYIIVSVYHTPNFLTGVQTMVNKLLLINY